MQPPEASGAPQFRNAILAALDQETIAALRPHLRHVTLVAFQVLHEVSAPIEHIHFVEDGLISFTADTGDAGAVEVGLMGRDGVAGAAVLLDRNARTAFRSIVQIGGTAFRLRADTFRELAARFPGLHGRCIRHVLAIMIQTSQCAACNASHEVPRRLARWLLMAQDAAGRADLALTHEFVARMLGVRRAAVSGFLQQLAGRGLIGTARGHITIKDRAGLEAASCACYGFIRDNRRRVLDGPPDVIA